MFIGSGWAGCAAAISANKEALIKLSKIINLNYICISGYSKFILSDYSNIIKNWRIKNKLIVQQAAKVLNVDSTTINRWEKDTYIVSKDIFEIIKDIIHK